MHHCTGRVSEPLYVSLKHKLLQQRQQQPPPPLLVMFVASWLVFVSFSDVISCPCTDIPPVNLTEPPPKDCHQIRDKFRYTCQKGYTRKAGTSSLIKCVQTGAEVEWTTSNLQCIREGHRFIVYYRPVESSPRLFLMLPRFIWDTPEPGCCWFFWIAKLFLGLGPSIKNDATVSCVLGDPKLGKEEPTNPPVTGE